MSSLPARPMEKAIVRSGRGRHAGIRTGQRRVLRLMLQDGLLAPSHSDTPLGPHKHEGAIISETVTTPFGAPTSQAL